MRKAVIAGTGITRFGKFLDCTMRSLAEENLIEVAGKTITVRDREAMETAAGLR